MLARENVKMVDLPGVDAPSAHDRHAAPPGSARHTLRQRSAAHDTAPPTQSAQAGDAPTASSC